MILIDANTKATKWAGDIYALAQRFKTDSGNKTGTQLPMVQSRIDLDELRAPVRSN